MSLKTTLNIRQSQVNKIISLADQYNVSKSHILNSLARIIYKSHNYKHRFLMKVQYQNRILHPYDVWKCLPVSFQEDVYEKCFDLKKLYKFSVSFFISIAIEQYLDELIIELNQYKSSDNYSSNYILIHSKSGSFNMISLIWDMIDTNTLVKLQEIHEKL